MNKNYLLAGVGGQGIILASKILAVCAMNENMKAKSAETIGMAQRGGCVVSHVRVGDGEILSPMVGYGEADVILAFEPGEAVRVLKYLKPGGCIVVSKKEVQPITASLANDDYSSEKMLEYLKNLGINIITVDSEYICNECGNSKILNIALLGAAAGKGVLGFSPLQVEKAISMRVAPKFVDLNLKALKLGAGMKGDE